MYLMRRKIWMGLLCGMLILSGCVRPVPVAPTPSQSPDETLPDPPLPLQALLPAYAGDAARLTTATRYDIHLDVDLPQVRGRQEVHYTNTETVTLKEIYFRLFPVLPGYGGAMTVTQVALDGQLQPSYLEQNGSALRVPLASPLEPGRSITLSLDFAVSVPRDNPAGYAQLDYADGLLTLPNIYPLIPAYDHAGWHIEMAPHYGDAVYSDTAFYTVEIKAPPGVLATTGVCSPPQAAGDVRQWTCVSGPARDFMIVWGSNYQTATQVVNGVTVRSSYLPEHAQAGQQALEYAARAVQIFSQRFGPYPFSEFDILETPTTAGGIEYPGLIVIAANLYDDPQEYFEWVIAHEVAHQWWYSLIGNDQVNHPWLDEALAQYSTVLYYEEAHDSATSSYLVNAMFEQNWKKIVEAGSDAPVDQPVGAFTEQSYGEIVYLKGPLFFHALRQAMNEQVISNSTCVQSHDGTSQAGNDEKFNAFLQTYYRQNLYGVASSQDLLEAAYTALDKSTVQCLYDEWIKGTRK